MPLAPRQDFPRALTKPYLRNIPRNSHVESISSPPQHLIDLPPPTPLSNVASNPGFPTYEQYKRIELAYLTALHPGKRQKALISQFLFDRIYHILMYPDSRNETPQFRFWVRKMFVLSDDYRPPSTGPEASAGKSGPVVLHDNRPVAIQEQLYGLICFFHSRAGHGGRDKTRATIRQHYSWVPKELVSQFVKTCPTCVNKKCGNPNLVAEHQVASADNRPAERGFSRVRTEPVLGSLENRTGVITQRVCGRPLNELPGCGPLAIGTTFPVRPTVTSEPCSFGRQSERHSSSPSVPALRSLYPSQTFPCQPMERERSNLPNGWRYDTEKCRTYMKENVPITKRPPILSVEPLENTSFCSNRPLYTGNPRGESLDKSVVLPPLINIPSGRASVEDAEAMPIRLDSQDMLPLSLQRLQVFPRQTSDALTQFRTMPTGSVFRGDETVRREVPLEKDFFDSFSGSDVSSNVNAAAAAENLRFTTPRSELQSSYNSALPPLDFSAIESILSFKDFQQRTDWRTCENPSPGDSSFLRPFSLSPERSCQSFP